MPDPISVAELELLVEENRRAFERAKNLLDQLKQVTRPDDVPSGPTAEPVRSEDRVKGVLTEQCLPPNPPEAR